MGTSSKSHTAPTGGIPGWLVLYGPVLAAVVAGTGWLLHSEWKLAGAWGFSLDDSWIYATFARNIATGHGYSFNPGVPVGGATGPLYALILSLLYAVFGSVIWPAKIFGIVCLAASCLLVVESVRSLGSRYDIGSDLSVNAAAVLAGALVAVSPPLLWGSVSGMELPLYLALACLGAFFYASERWSLASAAWSLGVWVRPDGVFLALLSLLHPKATRRGFLAQAAMTGLILGAYALFNHVVTGQVLPTAVTVKSASGNYPAREWSMLTQCLWLWGLSLKAERLGHHAVLLLPAMVVAMTKYARKLPAMVTYLVLFPFAFGLFGVNGGQNARYIAYVVPFGVILGCLGILLVANRVAASRSIRVILLCGALCLAWQINIDRMMGAVHGWNVQNINQMQRFLAEAANRASAPGDTIAVNDVGAMGFFSQRYIVDLVGLVSPRRSFPDNLSAYRPKFLIIFPDWYRQFETIDPQTGQGVFLDRRSTVKYSPILNLRLANNTIASRDEMVVYERLDPSQPGMLRVPTLTR